MRLLTFVLSLLFLALSPNLARAGSFNCARLLSRPLFKLRRWREGHDHFRSKHLGSTASNGEDGLGPARQLIKDFFGGPDDVRLQVAQIGRAIDLLSAVTGSEREAADDLLRDLSTELTSTHFLDQVAAAGAVGAALDLFEPQALHALRSVSRKTATDSRRIQDLADREMSESQHPDLDEVFGALKTIGDADRLNRFGVALIIQRQQHPDWFQHHAFLFLEAAGNLPMAKHVLELERTEHRQEMPIEEAELLRAEAVAVGDVEFLGRLKRDCEFKIRAASEPEEARRAWALEREKISRDLNPGLFR